MEISPFKIELCDQVACLHMQYLSTPFTGMAGRKLLNHYYQAVCRGIGAAGYIAQNEEEVLGYVCGIWNPEELKNIFLRRHWFSLTWWGFCQLLSKPSLLIDFVNRFQHHEQANKLPQGECESYELRPIVVCPAARGTGLARKLVDRLIEDAKSRGLFSMYLYAETDNVAAHQFYGKVGFQQVRRVKMSGKEFIRFQLQL